MTRPVPALCLLLGCLVCPLMAATPQQYDQALGKVQAALSSQSAALSADEVPRGEAASLVAQQTLGPIHSIETPGRAPQPVDTSALIGAVKAAESAHGADDKVAAFKSVGQQITLLRAQVVAPAPGRPEPWATVRSARAILARPEFGSDPLPPPSVSEKIAAWLDKIFSRRLPNGPQYSGPNINPNIILGILYTLAGGAFLILVYVIVQAIIRRGSRAARPLALDEEEAVLVESRDNDSLLALAEQQAKAGDYRRAFRLVYLASLVALDTGGVLRFDRSKTNWEYLRALRAAGRGDIYSAMTPLTREFDQVWYGFGRADASHYRRALAQYQALLAAPTGAAQT